MNNNVKNINNISHCRNRSKVQLKNRRKRVRIMVINANFNNISIISWRTVLLVRKTGVPGENHRPVTNHWQTLSHNVVSSIPHLSGIRNHNVSGDICTDCIASCKSNYHTITTTNAPLERYKIDTPNTYTCTTTTYFPGLVQALRYKVAGINQFYEPNLNLPALREINL